MEADTLIADKAFDADARVLEPLAAAGKTAVIPPRTNRSSVRDYDRELYGERRRFGWRRLNLLLEREGTRMNHKKLRRLYAEERLQVRRRGGRKRALGTRAPR
jgi:transposase InsO family protein